MISDTLYVSDLDGTLLNTHAKISRYSLNILNDLIEKGMKFTYATARSLSSASKVTEGLTLHIPVIIYNGVFIVEADTGKVLYATGFSDQEQQDIIKLLGEEQLFPLVYTYRDDQEKVLWYPSHENEGIRRYLSNRKEDKRMEPVKDEDSIYQGDMFYYTCIGEREKLEGAYQKLKKDARFRVTLQQELYRPEYWLEIMPAKASKANAIIELKKIWDCKRIVSFGDAVNDIPMFQISDRAYAVENAVEELKKYASGVIPSNEQDGVAVYLQREMRNKYQVKKLEDVREIRVQVPGSKSITNRALLLAALSGYRCRLHGVLFSDDSRAFLDSLLKLGFEVEADEITRDVTIQGMGGRIPNVHAAIHVRSAGTAARFLTVMLAFAGGEYELNASPQMCKRPMQPLLDLLAEAGVKFEFKGEEGHFPFIMKSDSFHLKEVSIDTSISSQFASAILMSGVMLKKGIKVHMLGDRAEGSYIKMTISIMKQFGIDVKKEGSSWLVPYTNTFGLKEYQVEPDVSGACYFYAMAPLLKTSVIVNNVHMDSLQGDIKFLNVLKEMGCILEERDEGVQVSGNGLAEYPGLDLSMKDFSDQTMTMAVLAPFAENVTTIRDIGHIRFQESDRIRAILTELGRMGVRCEEVPEADGIRIYPIDSGEIKETDVETYEDHRMAMSFTLIGLKTGRITIMEPECCRKTFENYFELIDKLHN